MSDKWLGTEPLVKDLRERLERAERERDELRRRIEIARGNLERRHSERDEARSELAALRAAVTGLADEADPDGNDMWAHVHVDSLRALLMDEGASHE